MWLLYKERLLTRVYRSKWAPNDTTVCILCGAAPETVQHLFSGCEVTRGLWSMIGEKMGLDTSFHSLEEMWAAGKAMQQGAGDGWTKTVLQIIVPAGAWAIWRTRNEAIFRGLRPYLENMWDMFLTSLLDWGRGLARAKEIAIRNGHLMVQGP
ncbi:hypothetical protein QJS10_CPA01g01157 [Acorus calamus]|uniref:Reverse transcriptase zinc-binding domain-containing protein n=1 Tax=Acorus calamus TaxID=4465 RepID=A0AAV9FMQ4_ACOCL|nr:hypothetical protein QJS10_CPA01g01157 [Acorus calamus]